MPLELSSRFPHDLRIDDAIVKIRIKRLDVDAVEVYQDKLVEFGFFPDQRGPAPELPPAEAFEQQRARDRAGLVWLREVLPGLVTIEPGQIRLDGDEITDPARLVDLFGARADGGVLGRLLLAILFENTLPEEKKTRLRSLFASEPGSPNAPPEAGSGERPVPTAGSAEPPATANPGAAMAPSSDASSGTTAPSSSVPVLSGA